MEDQSHGLWVRKTFSLVTLIKSSKYPGQWTMATGFCVGVGGGLIGFLASMVRDDTLSPIVHLTAQGLAILGFLLFGFGWIIAVFGIFLTLASAVDSVSKAIRSIVDTRK